MSFPLGEVFAPLACNTPEALVLELIGVLDALSAAPKTDVTPLQFMRENAAFCVCIAELRKNIFMIEDTSGIESILRSICMDRIHRGITIFTTHQVLHNIFGQDDPYDSYINMQMNILNLTGLNQNYTLKDHAEFDEYRALQCNIYESAEQIHIINDQYLETPALRSSRSQQRGNHHMAVAAISLYGGRLRVLN